MPTVNSIEMDVSWLMKNAEKDLITYQETQAISDMLGNTINTGERYLRN